MKQAYSYIRFSTPDQIKGDSQRRQAAMSQTYCEKNNLILNESLNLRDLGKSAFRGKNAQSGALKLFLDCVEEGKVRAGDVLIIESLDRLSRNKVGEALSLFIGILNKGVSIVTVNPERTFTKDSINDIAGILEPIIVMSRAHEESATKSKRLKSAWDQKRRNLKNKVITNRVLAWLSPKPDRSGFDLKQESVEIVRQIFQWAADGQGVSVITKKLNRLNIHNFGNRSKTGWHRSYVFKILHNRAVLGEFQPHSYDNGKRGPVGEVVPNYYPAIIKEDLFYRAQQAITLRQTQKGPSGKFIANFFTRLLFDANDGSSLNIVHKGKRSPEAKLVSSAATRGVPGSVYRSFSYRLFEKSFLNGMLELQERDFAKNQGDAKDKLEELQAKLADIESRIQRATDAATTGGNFDSILAVLQKLETQKKGAVAEYERLKGETSSHITDTIEDLKFMVEPLAKAQGEEKITLRQKIKGKIRQIVKEIWVKVDGPSGNGTIVAQVFYRNDKWKLIIIDEATGDMIANAEPKELNLLKPGDDFRLRHKKDTKKKAI